jgi:hypothetical protein
MSTETVAALKIRAPARFFLWGVGGSGRGSDPAGWACGEARRRLAAPHGRGSPRAAQRPGMSTPQALAPSRGGKKIVLVSSRLPILLLVRRWHLAASVAVAARALARGGGRCPRGRRARKPVAAGEPGSYHRRPRGLDRRARRKPGRHRQRRRLRLGRERYRWCLRHRRPPPTATMPTPSGTASGWRASRCDAPTPARTASSTT